jgi:phosphotransferase system enzyme I (PtsI)
MNVPTVTLDQHKVELSANIGKPTDAHTALANGAEGIGLYRSEFLYMDNDHWPTEEEQFTGYKDVLEQMNGKLTVIRTLDIGGDKKLSYYQFPQEMNPFLGYRAIRFCLDNKEIFKTQLRALGRSSAFGKLGVMFPMVATIDEFKEAKAFAEETFAELRKEGHKVSDDIQLGMMTEIPSSAILANQFSKYVDFFSIGTNDLNQYAFACDRMSQKVSYLYQPNNPALLSLIKMTIDGGHNNKH